MKVLKQIFQKDDHVLTTKPTKIKLHLKKPGAYEQINIEGVPAIQSDNSDSQEQLGDLIVSFKQNLDSFKLQKAHEVAACHLKSGKSIQTIIDEMKKQIDEEFNRIVSREQGIACDYVIKSPKQLASTVANSDDKQKSADTPSFDLLKNIKQIHEFSIDLRQFTLGQRDKSTSGSSKQVKHHQDHEVSEFSVGTFPKQSSSKRIKDRIMNSGKNKAK